MQITNYGITEFVQGQTRRWAIAWSFNNIRLPDVCLHTLHIRRLNPTTPTVSRSDLQFQPQRDNA